MTGWGSYVPVKVVTNNDLPPELETSDEWIVQRTGIRERRIAAADETTCTLSLNASREALAKAGIQPSELDLIIVATSTPDHHTPPVSSLLQHALGATDVPAFVVVTGCTGFVYALSTAYQFIHSGAYRTILVVGVELLSRFVDWTDRSMCVLFGDAAGAVVVQATDRPCGMRSFVLGSDGSQGEQIIMRGGGSARPFSQEVLDGRQHYVQMNGREVFKFATRVVGPACEQAAAKAGLTLADIDWIIPHQANLRIIQTAAKLMDFPLERFIVNIERYANTSAASIPLALTENLTSGRILPTDRLMFVSFGAGLTWGAAVVEMSPR
ncbi:MAG: ketoacyl-ACP synthase III [Caldilineaceae bacterium]|nr:ketoacyl-ACP synthase III [Caldilineaceae bacterium]HRJ45696.1 beta-ketoacyl-ACP synthase III [Caldilineaceae bacterium]